MMQSYASAAKAPGRRVHSKKRLEKPGENTDHRHLGSSSVDRVSWAAKCVVLLSIPFSFIVVSHYAGRKTMPSDTSPVVTRRQSATEQLSRTIIVLRVLPRPSAVRV
jgi:hypothetical protein